MGLFFGPKLKKIDIPEEGKSWTIDSLNIYLAYI